MLSRLKIEPQEAGGAVKAPLLSDALKNPADIITQPD